MCTLVLNHPLVISIVRKWMWCVEHVRNCVNPPISEGLVYEFNSYITRVLIARIAHGCRYIHHLPLFRTFRIECQIRDYKIRRSYRD